MQPQGKDEEAQQQQRQASAEGQALGFVQPRVRPGMVVAIDALASWPALPAACKRLTACMVTELACLEQSWHSRISGRA